MKKLTLTLFILLFSSAVFSQTVNEKSIAKFPGVMGIYAYDIAYNKTTGNYVYGYYDTTAKKTDVYTQNGKTGTYNKNANRQES